MEPPEQETAKRRMASWRDRLHTIIFEADTPAGKAFDVALLVAILLSITVVMLDSVQDIRFKYETALLRAEWVFTILFTIEYTLRLLCVRKPLNYARSFYGVVDLLAVVPTYLTLLPTVDTGPASLMVVRALRLLRVFRVFKLTHMLSEATTLRRAVVASRGKITIFLTTVLIVVVIMGTAMHLVEGRQSGFDSIPDSMYWAIVTVTTVGYGDTSPSTPLGKTLAAFMMVVGYSLIIVPTGILSAELSRTSGKPVSTQACPECSREGHDVDAVHCKFCGSAL